LQREKDTFGAVVFVNGTTATNRDANISLYEYLDVGYGLGLRVMIMKKSRANLAIDYAWGKYGAHGFYFGLNEVFLAERILNFNDNNRLRIREKCTVAMIVFDTG